MSEPRSTTAFVTGGTGFLGWEIVRQLLERGDSVIALSRTGELPGHLPSASLTVVKGDLNDISILQECSRRASVVYHVAADVRMWRARWDEIEKTNVVGTRNVAKAALEAGISKLVYTSTGSTIGKPYPPTQEIVTVDETSEYNFAPLRMVYPHTKWLGEQEVKKAIQNGLDAVILHPTAVFGPGDWKRNVLALFLATKTMTGRFATNGIRTTCDVRDVAAAHLEAAKRGRKGEHYILGGERLPVRELLSRIARAARGRPPIATLPDWAVLGIARGMETAAALTGKPPKLSYEMALQSTLRAELSSAKAERELGYRPRPLDESLQDAAAFYRERGWL